MMTPGKARWSEVDVITARLGLMLLMSHCWLTQSDKWSQKALVIIYYRTSLKFYGLGSCILGFNERLQKMDERNGNVYTWDLKVIVVADWEPQQNVLRQWLRICDRQVKTLAAPLSAWWMNCQFQEVLLVVVENSRKKREEVTARF